MASEALIGVFSGVGTVPVVLGAQGAMKWLKSYRDARRNIEDAPQEDFRKRLALLEQQVAAMFTVVTDLNVFIKGSEDPYRKNPDGSPVINGGLLPLLALLEQKLKLEPDA
jgi:hypothetical protein